MKTPLLIIGLFVLPLISIAQVHGGLQVGVYPSSLVGQFTSPQGRVSYSAGIWVQKDFSPGFGLKTDLLYMPKGGRVLEQDFKGDFITLGLMPRFRIDDISSKANLLVGVGPYTHFGIDSDIFNNGEIGPQFEIGAEWGPVALVFSGQIGLLDAIDSLPKKQRWVSIGLAMQGRIF